MSRECMQDVRKEVLLKDFILFHAADSNKAMSA